MSLDGGAFVLVQYLDREQPCVCCTGYVLHETAWPEGRGGDNPAPAWGPRKAAFFLECRLRVFPQKAECHMNPVVILQGSQSSDVMLSASSRVLLLRAPLPMATIPQRAQVSSTVLSASSFHSSRPNRL